jgi:hypothetical protein
MRKRSFHGVLFGALIAGKLVGKIDNPAVARRPSKYSLPSRGRSSGVHRGE